MRERKMADCDMKLYCENYITLSEFLSKFAIMVTDNMIGEIHRPGRIEVVCGSMFSGKTEELIRRLKRAKFAKQNVEIFKPAMDTRYSNVDVVSHDHNSIHSTPVSNAEAILARSAGHDIVGIDEAQFLDDKLVDVCNKMAYRGIRVIVAGLDMDFRGVPFGPIPALCAVADEVTKVHAICVRCGSLAYASHRLVKNDSQVMLGEKLEYEPLCRDCFQKAVEEDHRNSMSGNLFENIEP